MQLLQDTFIIENLQVLSEAKNDGKMRVAGIFGRCNEKNNNGRIYPTAVLEGQLKKIQPMISERRLCGELDHPQNDSVKLSNASHLITKLEMKGDELIGEAEILNTPAGLTAQALVKGGVKIGISSRGMGTLSEDQNGDKIVNEDFRLVTFDLVADPSTRGAYPGLSESTESQFVRETVDKLQKEQNFVTMLEAKMRDAYTPFLEEAKKKKKKNKDDKKKKGKEGPTDDDGATTNDSLDPVGQGDADMDNDGDSDSSDKYLKNRREAIAAAMKNEGSWHQIAYAIADRMNLTENVADTLAGRSSQGPEDEGLLKTALRQRMNRRSMKKDAIAAAKAGAKAAKITAKGRAKAGKIDAKSDVKTGRIRGVGAAKTDAKAGKIKAKGTAKADRIKGLGAAKTAAKAGRIKGVGAAKTAAKADKITGVGAARTDARAGKIRAKGEVAAGRIKGVGDAKTAGKVDRVTNTQSKLTARSKDAPLLRDRAQSAAKAGAEAVRKNAPKVADAARRGVAAARENAPAAADAIKRGAGAAADAVKTGVDKLKARRAGQPAAEAPKDPVNPELRARAASLRDKGNAPKQNPNIAGPKGKLPEWTVWRQMGRVMAEAWGLV